MDETNICIWCKKEFDYDAKICDSCWELWRRIQANPNLAKQMLAALGE